MNQWQGQGQGMASRTPGKACRRRTTTSTTTITTTRSTYTARGASPVPPAGTRTIIRYHRSNTRSFFPHKYWIVSHITTENGLRHYFPVCKILTEIYSYKGN